MTKATMALVTLFPISLENHEARGAVRDPGLVPDLLRARAARITLARTDHRDQRCGLGILLR